MGVKFRSRIDERGINKAWNYYWCDDGKERAISLKQHQY
jgi:hypothetical protein